MRTVLEVFRLAVGRESLGAPPPASHAPEPRSSGIIHLLFVSREPLGEEPAGPPRARRPLLRWLLAPEELPYDPVPPEPRRRGRLAALFAPEHLDDDSP